MSSIEDRKKLLGQVLDTNNSILGVIYVITNMVNQKQYVGQTVSHKLNTKKYRPFGCQKRLKQHTSDAVCNTKKHQCTCLNNAIRKYGRENFKIEVIEYCLPDDANELEIRYIKQYNSIAPSGYNLSEGGGKGPTEQAQKEKLMLKSQEQYRQQKFDRFKDVVVDLTQMDSYVREYYHERYGGTYFVVNIKGNTKRMKTMFVGQHSTAQELKKQAIDFVHELARRSATHLNCGNVC